MFGSPVLISGDIDSLSKRGTRTEQSYLQSQSTARVGKEPVVVLLSVSGVKAKHLFANPESNVMSAIDHRDNSKDIVDKSAPFLELEAEFEITEEEFPELYALTMEAIGEFDKGLAEQWP